MYVSFKWRGCWWDGCTTDLLWSVPIPQSAWYPCVDGNSCIRWSYSFIFQWFLCIGPKCCCFNPHFCLDQTFPDFGLHQGAMVLTCFDPPVSLGYTAKGQLVPMPRYVKSGMRIPRRGSAPVLGIELGMTTDLHYVAAWSLPAYPTVEATKDWFCWNSLAFPTFWRNCCCTDVHCVVVSSCLSCVFMCVYYTLAPCYSIPYLVEFWTQTVS